jgi:hypothetical protein
VFEKFAYSGEREESPRRLAVTSVLIEFNHIIRERAKAQLKPLNLRSMALQKPSNMPTFIEYTVLPVSNLMQSSSLNALVKFQVRIEGREAKDMGKKDDSPNRSVLHDAS